MKNELTANHKQTDRNIKTDHYLKVEGICSLKDSFDIIKPKPLASWISHTLADFPLNNKPISSWQKKKEANFRSTICKYKRKFLKTTKQKQCDLSLKGKMYKTTQKQCNLSLKGKMYKTTEHKQSDLSLNGKMKTWLYLN